MSLGHDRERRVVDRLRDEDWIAFRAPGSLGVADVVALKDGHQPRLIEVKATAAGPYHGFVPADRERLRAAALMAGAKPELAWWPPRGTLRFIGAGEWP